MSKDQMLRVTLTLLKMLGLPLLGALGATLFLVYPEGFIAFCGQR